MKTKPVRASWVTHSDPALRWRVAVLVLHNSVAKSAIDPERALADLVIESDRVVSEVRRISEQLLTLSVHFGPSATEAIGRLQEVGAEAAHLVRGLQNSAKIEI